MILNPALVWTATMGISGVYQLQVPSGIYTVTVTAPGYTSAITTGIAVQISQTTVLDIDMAPCTVVSGVGFDYAPPKPRMGETVFFTGTAAGGTAVMPITYAWDFGDNITHAVAVDTITHTFPLAATAQTYTVSLTIANGCPSQMKEKKAITVWSYIHSIYLPLVLKDH